MNRIKKIPVEKKAAAALGLAAFCIYMLTLAPTASWGDSAKLVMLAAKPQIAVEAGYHVLHNYVGHVFMQIPVGGPAFRINMLSAVFGALTVALVLLICFRMTRSLFASAAAAAMYALSHIQWHVSVMAESYSMVLFFTALITYALLRHSETDEPKYILAASILLGLGMNLSLLFAFLGPGIVLMILARKFRGISGRSAAVAVTGFALGMFPLVTNFLILSAHEPVSDLLYRGLSMRYTGYFFLFHPAAALKGMVLFFAALFYQFPLVGFVAGFAGLSAYMKKNRGMALYLAAGVLFIALFTSTYMIQRRFLIMSTAFLLFTPLAAAGIDRTVKKLGGFIGMKTASVTLAICTVVLPVMLYAATPALIRNFKPDAVPARKIPFRDNASYFLQPWKNGDHGPELFARSAFKTAGDGIIVSDFTPLSVLEYYKNFEPIENARAELVMSESKNMEEFLRANLDGKRIFIVDKILIGAAENKYKLVQKNVLIEVLKKE